MISITEGNPHITKIQLNLYHGISSNTFIKTVNSCKDCRYNNAFTFSTISVALHPKKYVKKKEKIEKAYLKQMKDLKHQCINCLDYWKV